MHHPKLINMSFKKSRTYDLQEVIFIRVAFDWSTGFSQSTCQLEVRTKFFQCNLSV
jgi:hypothetical protein